MSNPVQKVRVYEKEDRRTLAAILTANGYAVWQGKEAKTGNKKALDYCVYFKEPEEDDAGSKE